MRGSLEMDCLMATANRFSLTATLTKEIGSTTCSMDMARKNGVLEGAMLGIINRAKNTVKASTSGPIIVGMRETGPTI